MILNADQYFLYRLQSIDGWMDGWISFTLTPRKKAICRLQLLRKYMHLCSTGIVPNFLSGEL